jgi:hypothetical protein
MGFFGNLAAEKFDRQYSDKELLNRSIEYFKPHWRKLLHCNHRDCDCGIFFPSADPDL